MFAIATQRLPVLATAFSAVFLAACSSAPTATPVAPVARAAAPAPAAAPVYVTPQSAPPPVVVYAPAPAPVVSMQPSSSVQAAPISSPGADALREGLAAFQKRDYRTAEAKLAQSQEQGLSQLNEVQQAYKTQAFVYCQSKRTVKCEEAFTELLSLDRTFELSSSERRNPAWASTFAKVKQRMRK